MTQIERPANVRGIAVYKTVLKRLTVVRGPMNKFFIAPSELLDEKLIIIKEIVNAINTAIVNRKIAKYVLKTSTFDFLPPFIIGAPSLPLHSVS